MAMDSADSGIQLSGGDAGEDYNSQLQILDTLSQSAPPLSRTSAARASKKRPRAMKRAPATVLTTSASNFRAMVQEFTGGPSSSLFPEIRPDLFSGTGVSWPSSRKLPHTGSSSSTPDKAALSKTCSSLTAPSATSFSPSPADQLLRDPMARSCVPKNMGTTSSAGSYSAANARASARALLIPSEITAGMTVGGGKERDDPLRLIEGFMSYCDGEEQVQVMPEAANFGYPDQLSVSTQNLEAEKGSANARCRREDTFDSWVRSFY